MKSNTNTKMVSHGRNTGFGERESCVWIDHLRRVFRERAARAEPWEKSLSKGREEKRDQEGKVRGGIWGEGAAECQDSAGSWEGRTGSERWRPQASLG